MTRLSLSPAHLKQALLATAALAGVACSDAAAPTAARRPELKKSTTTVVDYDARSLADYQQKWANAYGPLELTAGGSMGVSPAGEVTVRAVPFHVGADYSVYDHLKYIAVSTREFPVPEAGSLMFSVRIEAETPGVQDGRVIHGCYGAPYSYQNVGDPCAQPWSQRALEGQQAGVVLNMINFATGQLFDWFVSEGQVFALVERLPSNVTAPGLLPGQTGYAGLDKAYTQIIKAAPVNPKQHHDVAIRYTRGPGVSMVEYFLDGKPFATVNNVGIPLDVQGVPFTGTYPSYGRGELLNDGLDSFVIGHGLFSLLDAFPFQHPERPDLSVSVPMSERLFGQGAVGSWRKFTVTTSE